MLVEEPSAPAAAGNDERENTVRAMFKKYDKKMLELEGEMARIKKLLEDFRQSKSSKY